MKTCDICHDDLDDGLFGKNRSKPAGRHSTCKACKNRLDKSCAERNKADGD